MLVPCHLSANIVGGLPILCYFIYSYRGHMDHLTENLRFVKYICRVEPTIYKLMTRILLVTESRGDRQLDQLVLDPQSLPIRSISDNFSFIKNSVHSQMHDMVKNPRILDFCPNYTELEKDTLLDTITTVEPCNP